MAEKNAIFKKEMKKTHTILIPNMAPIHFDILKNVFIQYGYQVELLQNTGQAVIDTGLKYVHNDTCYPALLVIGQMIDALQSGKYDLDRTAVVITQTGGGCRASNYFHLLKKALLKADLAKVPVISLNLSGLEKESSLKITLPMIRRACAALVYGDLLMLLDNQVKPYEIVSGSSKAVVDKWVSELSEEFKNGSGLSKKQMTKNFELIVKSFAAIPLNRTPKVKVGIVGEIYVKYSSLANNGLEQFLFDQDCEVMVPGILGFFLYCMDNGIEETKLYGGKRFMAFARGVLLRYMEGLEKNLIDAVKKYSDFVAPSPYAHLSSLCDGIIGKGTVMGEGWLLTAEMLELVEQGYGNIVCTQPFGCLPNHIVGKGMIRKIREKHPEANIVPIDYDPGATKVNQENRIKLMLAVAKENLEKKTMATEKKETANV